MFRSRACGISQTSFSGPPGDIRPLKTLITGCSKLSSGRQSGSQVSYRRTSQLTAYPHLVRYQNVMLYFAYGSNLWKDQMKSRCPESKLFGVGKVKGWKWIINARGYANLIPSPKNTVYGFLYELTQEDEKRLDRFEGVGVAYGKMKLTVCLVSAKDSDVNTKGTTVNVMSYIDKRLEEGKVVEEYIGRMKKAIKDGIEEGIPKEYFERYVCPYL